MIHKIKKDTDRHYRFSAIWNMLSGLQIKYTQLMRERYFSGFYTTIDDHLPSNHVSNLEVTSGRVTAKSIVDIIGADVTHAMINHWLSARCMHRAESDNYRDIRVKDMFIACAINEGRGASFWLDKLDEYESNN